MDWVNLWHDGNLAEEETSCQSIIKAQALILQPRGGRWGNHFILARLLVEGVLRVTLLALHSHYLNIDVTSVKVVAAGPQVTS